MGEEKRHEMMETLFGAESEDSEEEDPEALERPAYSDDEAEGGGQVGVESEGERAGSDLEKEESEAERIESEAEREDSDAGHSYDESHGAERNRDGGRSVRQPAEESDPEQSFGEGDEVEENRYGTADSRRIQQQIEESDGDHSYSEDEADQGRFEKRTRKQQISASGSDKSHGHDADEEEENEVFHRASNAEEDEDEDEVEQVREASEEGYGGKASGGVAELRDVFGDSDEEDQGPAAQPHSPQEQGEMSPSDDEASVQRGIRPEDIVPDEEQREDHYDSDEEQPAERRAREKPVGPPLHLDVPFASPLGHPDKMHVVRVSNIMGIEPKPFDPKTYIEEEEQFITDETGHKQRIRLEDNVARWRLARNRDGSLSYESNARFVKWSDGSMQLLIGNEVLDISVQKANQDQAHLFVRHGKGILQSQGRLLQKMKFMPSSLSSKSHRLLTALVDSRNRKVFKVKNVITNKDPEREKEEAEKLQEQRIRSKEDLQRKQEKINRKYQSVRERVEPQLSPGFLEGALEEDEEVDEYPQSHNARRFQEQLEAEGRAERRIINAKRQSAPSREPVIKRPKDRRPVQPKRRQEELYSEESEREPSEYGSDDQEDMMQMNQMEQEEEPQGEEEEEEQEQEDEEEEEDYNQHGKARSWDDEEDEPVKKRKERDESDENESPPRKPVQRRRVVVSDSEEED